MENKKLKGGYSGSLFAQNFGEGDYEFHGYLMWDISNPKNITVTEHDIKNEYSFKTISVSPYTDFDDLDIDIENPTKYMKIRVLWKTLPQTHNEDNKRKLTLYLKEVYKPISISHKNEFIEDTDLVIENEIDISNINEQKIQHDIFLEYLDKTGTPQDIVDEIIKLDDEITSRIEIEELTNIEWDIVKFSGKNFMSYEDINVDWRDLNGLFQITGLNAVGKTTIMKLITYVLFNKTRETEKVIKFGDQRYINNRNSAESCEGIVILKINGEFFGVKRNTIIQKNKNGEIKGAPTTLNYYKLDNPDDELTDDNSLENLIDDERNKTQNKLEKAIGSYDNFMRVVMTTSDTLNDILSSDKAVFIDSILYDSGLDIFDHKLNSFKEYNKELSSIPRVYCNVESSEDLIKKLNLDVEDIDNKISEIESNNIPECDSKIEKGENHLENLIKKLYKVDDEIYNLDVDSTNKKINDYTEKIKNLNDKKNRLNISIDSLKSEYDEDKLLELQDKKNEHEKYVREIRSTIKDIERDILDLENNKGWVNGDIKRLKENGKKLKEKIFKLRSEKNCPTCGQKLDDKHQEHINDNIKEIESEMFEVVDDIKSKTVEIPLIEKSINESNANIETHKSTIDLMSIDMENILNEIGIIVNDKNEVDRRKELFIELDKIPLEMENFNLQIENLQNKINLFNQNQKQIEENQKINVGIEKSKERLKQLKFEKDSLKDDIYILKTKRGDNISKIRETNDLILKFKEQERQDLILNTYKKCIHRDGIPTQLLITYAIPKINKELTNLLSDVDFNVWLDIDDLKLKLAYNSRLDAVIDAISASGKERTFASVVLKFALNQINMKSKPTLLLLDEVCGKLVDDSVSEFVGVLDVIKNRMNKVIIIEHNHFINPDYYIDVEKDKNDISILNIR